METQEVIQIIKNNFQNVSICNENVIRGEARYRDRVTSISYFDYSQKAMDLNFDLNDYQERIIAKDYYNYKGDLQWNLYLYFICDLAKIDENIKKEIENNTIFTRKYVVTPDYLSQLIVKKTGEQTIQYSPKEDISTLWINKLRDKDLDGVYLDKTYKEVIDQISAGKPLKDTDGVVYQGNVSEREKLPFADKIKLKNFRNYPKDFNFIFKRVNLIKGPNGCGKTSLLESIELCLCGKTNRNKRIVENADIILTFRDGTVDTYERDNNAKHLARDLLWYGNMAVRVNRLCESFNRYNLYDSDAAYRLSTSTKLKDIQDAFYSLALGQNANIIDEKLNKYLEKLLDVARIHEKEIESLSSLMRDEERALGEISEIKDNPTVYFDAFVDEAKHNRWKGFLPKNMEDDLAKFETNSSEAEILIRELKQKIYWVQDLNVKILKDEKDKYSKFSKVYSDYNLKLSKDREAIKEHGAKLKELQDKDAILKEALRYVAEENIHLLVGLEDKIKEVSQSKNKFNVIKELSKNIFRELIDDEKVGLNECEESLVKLINNYVVKLKSVTENIEVIKLTVSKSESIIEEIKAKGIEFLNMHSNENECPLCNARYGREELINKIKTTYKKTQGGEVLETFFVERSGLEKKIHELEKKIKNLHAIKQAAYALFEFKTPSEISIGVFFKEINKLNASYINVEDNLNKFLGLRENFLSKGLNEKDFLRVKENFIFYFPNLELRYENKAKFIELSQTIKNDIELTNKKLNVSHLTTQSQDDNRIKEISDLLGISHENLETIGKEIEIRKTNLDYALRYLEKLLQMIDLLDADKFDDLLFRLKRIESIFEKFKNCFNTNKQNSIIVSKSKKKICDLKNKLDEIKTIKARVDNAISAIGDILENYNKKRYLEDFLNTNNSEIVNIFREIHSPREFSNINFYNTQGEDQIFLVREKKAMLAPLTQISSGQRSALSIAIFLALNKTLKNAPPFVILDDPVAHVDDLNVLSFLDFLRDLVLYGNKQIFFATADRKMASFFEKKFSFLDNEFQSVDLPELMKQKK